MRYVIGDIHGMLSKLKNLVDQILDQDDDPEFYFTGDYVDRGPDSSGVIDYLIALKKRFTCHFMRGNHDDVICYILGLPTLCDFGSLSTYSTGEAVRWFMVNGIEATFSSYKINAREHLNSLLPHEYTNLANMLNNAVPQSHKDFLRQTQLYQDEGRFLVVHGDYCVDPTECLWNRPNYNLIDHGKQIVVGHTPTRNIQYGVDTIIRKDKYIFVDCGAAYGGQLAAICMDDGKEIYG